MKHFFPSFGSRFGIRAACFFVALSAVAIPLFSSTKAIADETPLAPTFSETTGSMSTVRWVHGAVTLFDGRTFVAGGFDKNSAESAEIYDPQTGVWAPTSPPQHRHSWPVVARLCDGRVYVGGQFSTTIRNAEIYDPVTDTWADAGVMKYAHIYGTATTMADCRVMLVGGFNANTKAEIYDPVTGLYSAAGTTGSERFFHTTTVLANGRILVAAGGVDINGVWYTYPTASVFDPLTNAWTPVQNLNRKRRSHTATLLPDGRVLVSGGTTGGKNDGVDGGTQLATSEIFDPTTGTWELLPNNLNTARSFHTAHTMPNGAIVLFGGLDATGSASRQVEAFYQGTWFAMEPLNVDRFQHASAQLLDGRVVLAGGVHQATAEVYSLAQTGLSCGAAFTCSSGFCVDGVCCEEACDTGCRKCNLPGKEGKCERPCADDLQTWVCPDGSSTCPNAECVTQRCSPFRCDAEATACLVECSSVEDCAPGYACDPNGTCVTPPDVSGVEVEACSASTDPNSTPLVPGLGLVLAGFCAAFRRRRSTR